MKGLIKTATAYKCYYSINAHRELDYQRNKGIMVKECPRCSSTESWKYVIQCIETRELRLKFIIDLYKELKAN